MGLNKDGVDWKAIDRDQRAIDALPNRGRVQAAKHKALKSKIVGHEIRKKSYGEKMRDTSNLESIRGKKTKDIL